MQEAHPNKVTFVLGGVRSGKSRFAQRIASASGSVVFIATARPSDPEMELRIERHRKRRRATKRRAKNQRSRSIQIDCVLR